MPALRCDISNGEKKCLFNRGATLRLCGVRPQSSDRSGHLPGWSSQIDRHNYDAPLLTAIAEDAHVEFDHNIYKPFLVP